MPADTGFGDSARVHLGLLKRQGLRSGHGLLLRAGTSVRHTASPPVRPIFIIGCPRSGTSLLFNLLRRHDDLASLSGEGHVLWNAFQHPRNKGWESDRATAEDIKPREPAFIYSAIAMLSRGRRWLDKTPKNSLKVSYLDALFPDAVFILLKRDGRATVNSLIEGWQVRQTVSYRLPDRLDLTEYKGKLWSYVLPDGWRRWARTTVAEVAAFQYAAAYETALNDLEAVSPERVIELSFEDLLSRPEVRMARLLESLELSASDSVAAMAADLPSYPIVANSPPRPEKWRQRSTELARVAPLFEPAMKRLGYEVPAER